MRSKLMLLSALAFISALLAFRLRESATYLGNKKSILISEHRKPISCSPDWNELQYILEETSIPPIPGAGNYKWPVSTKSDSAQFYFNQGINMYYGFHIVESMASFIKASGFDTACAMLYWAQALCYGPNINDFGYRASAEALNALQKAKEHSSGGTMFERSLISAMGVRYTADSADATRSELNSNYSNEMKKVFESFPDNPDAMALYADALMLQHPWDLWNNDGSPKSWTPAIRSVLEKLIGRYPDHPGGNHYYIHVMEPSPFAGKALPSAYRLGITNPGLSHLVHMPSHIYLRTGNYNLGVEVNIKAVESYKKTIPLFPAVTGADFLYQIHNHHMKTNNAMLTGNYLKSEDAALETVASIPASYLSIPAPLGNYVQYIYSTPALVYVRFGKWEELLMMKEPEKTFLFANIIYHFGKGMALAGTDKIAEAKNELVLLQELMKDSSLYIPLTPFSPMIESAAVARDILKGTIALKEKELNDAIISFKEAVMKEESMVYNEPRDWLLNPKHYLANAYLKAGRTKEAKQTLRKDLDNNNENGWALFGLWQALSAEKKLYEANNVLSRFRKAFKEQNIKLSGPVF